MSHLLYMAFIDPTFSSKNASLFFLLLCRTTFLLTPLLVSLYDKRLSVLNLVFGLRDLWKSDFDPKSIRWINGQNDEIVIEEELTMISIRKRESYKYDIHN